MKTLAIRLEDELHLQLTVLAQLDGITITDAIRQAIEAYVGRLRDSDELSTKAQAMLDDIEREADTRRAAIAALLSSKRSPDEGSTGTRILVALRVSSLSACGSTAAGVSTTTLLALLGRRS